MINKVWFEPEEFLSIHLVKFADDVFDGVLKAGYYDMLNSVYTSICGPDNFIQNCEGGLERCELH